MKIQIRRKLFVLSVLPTALLALTSFAWAHHGSRISYDLTKQVTLKGIVKDFVYVNPHVYFTFEVKDDKGKVTVWAAETDPPIMMENRFKMIMKSNPEEAKRLFQIAQKDVTARWKRFEYLAQGKSDIEAVNPVTA